MEHTLTTYIRTKTVHKHRLKDLKDYDSVKVYQYELRVFLRGPREQWGYQLQHLRDIGQISFDMKDNFTVLKEGPIDFRLLDLTKKRPKLKVPLTPLHVYMRKQLMHIELKIPDAEKSVYFKAFLAHRKSDLASFFTVDAFSNRVHTPVVVLGRTMRDKLLFYGKPVVSLDVKQMQPTILAKILEGSVGDNPFSKAIFEGKDVYELIKDNNQTIKTRDEAKKMFFTLVFGKPMDDIGTMFRGDTRWVDWINSYKSRTEYKNPHKEEPHTNLAWLLQYSEVQVMSGIWQRLKNKNIPFLTVHDDILCLRNDKEDVYSVMNEELSKNFKNFSITVNHGL